LEELVEFSDIESISYFEIAATRVESDELLEPGDHDEQIQPTHLLQTAHRGSEDGFRVRIRTEIEVDVGSIVVDVAAEYTLVNATTAQITPELMVDFVNKVAVMTLVPYLRNAVADITLRVFGTALTMPIMRRGELEFELPNELDPEKAKGSKAKRQ
jgi:hypothetical protein